MKQIVWMAVLLFTMTAAAQQRERREKTTFQTGASWKLTTDVRADVVMCYGGANRDGFRGRVDSWRNAGYATHYMTGIAWGEYQDYFSGRWDGVAHLDEGQKNMHADTIWHGRMVPYIVPTRHYLEYFKERHIKPVIDAGIDAIFLEEPEFWARAGYSEAFKREWQDYYGFEWRPQHESAENTYLSNKLKYHLYYRALDECFRYAKAYGKEKGLDVRCYVPTHSLLNYAQWQIVSPEASLASLDAMDGYIAQVWTGTSREPNYYNGEARERVFETAFLEYGCMESMTRPTRRKMFFLTDPIEDRARDWQDYKRNYQATFTAQLLYPQIADYEIMPWPDRIYEGLYRVSMNSKERARIPKFYSTQMQVMTNALGLMPKSDSRLDGTQGISVAMANSLMFQRAPQQVEGYDDPQLSNFYGMAMPLVKRGIPVSITHLENVQYPATWQDVQVLLLSYSNMKPMSPDVHRDIAKWVYDGGKLVYCGRDDDAFQRVREWWNTAGFNYASPADHLWQLMNIPQDAPEGAYAYGKGEVRILRQNPKEFAMEGNGDARLIATLHDLCGKTWQEKNHYQLLRAPYRLAAVLSESPAGDEPLTMRGAYLNLFSHELDLHPDSFSVAPGEQAFLYDLRYAPRDRASILASASRVYEQTADKRDLTFVTKGPRETTNVVAISIPGRVKEAQVRTMAPDGSVLPIVSQRLDYCRQTRCSILRVEVENRPNGVQWIVRTK